jgi:hypothetical protein
MLRATFKPDTLVLRTALKPRRMCCLAGAAVTSSNFFVLHLTLVEAAQAPCQQEAGRLKRRTLNLSRTSTWPWGSACNPSDDEPVQIQLESVEHCQV